MEGPTMTELPMRAEKVRKKRKRTVRKSPDRILRLYEIAQKLGVSRGLLNAAKVAAGYPPKAKRLDYERMRKFLVEEYPDFEAKQVRGGVFYPLPRGDRRSAIVDINDVRGGCNGL